MNTFAGESVTLQVAAPRAIAAVRARVRVGRVAAVFAHFLDQVYAASKGDGIRLDGQNVFVYRDVPDAADEIDVEFGVGATAPFSLAGSVRYCQLPVGEVATITHWGDYARLGEAHDAIIEWCRGHQRERAGTRWEVYGHWTGDPTQQRTDVYYLLRPQVSP